MKNIKFLAVIAMVALFASCQKEEELYDKFAYLGDGCFQSKANEYFSGGDFRVENFIFLNTVENNDVIMHWVNGEMSISHFVGTLPIQDGTKIGTDDIKIEFSADRKKATATNVKTGQSWMVWLAGPQYCLQH